MDHKYIEAQVFDKIDFTENPIQMGEYEYCTFASCNFTKADLSQIRFLDCEFLECNFSNTILKNTSFLDVSFKDCKMIGLHFDQCNTYGLEVTFERCQLNYSSFFEVTLTKTIFNHCQLHFTDFTRCNLSRSEINHCDLLNATFHDSILEKVDFRHSTQYNIDPDMNKIKGAKFSLPDALSLLNKYKIQIT